MIRFKPRPSTNPEIVRQFENALRNLGHAEFVTVGNDNTADALPVDRRSLLAPDAPAKPPARPPAPRKGMNKAEAGIQRGKGSNTK